MEKVKEVSDDTIPLFTSDELRHYEGAILKTYGLLQKVPREPGKRGRPSKPKLVPHPDLKYAQVVKHRRRGRVISIETAVIFGDEGEIKELLSSSPVSRSINISAVERNNLSLRQNSKRLARKTNGFSKELERLEAQLYLASGYYHFVKEHLGLRLPLGEATKKWKPRTPAMAAGITDHIWSTRELLVYRVPKFQ